MPSRMEKYKSLDQDSPRRRSEKNKTLYDNLYTRVSYTEFSDIESDNVIDLSEIDKKNVSRRTEYHRIKGAPGIVSKEKRDYSDRYLRGYQFSDLEDRDYDINSVLEKAKLNRSDIDELERKRKLRTTQYNILADLTEEKLKSYQEQKKEVLSREEEVELLELINTITSNTMRVELDQELLSDLMPNELDETIVTSNLVKNDQEDPLDETNLQIDQSFFTKSMDLSDEDFVSIDEQHDESFKIDDQRGLASKIILSIIVIAIIIGLCFLIYNIL